MALIISISCVVNLTVDLFNPDEYESPGLWWGLGVTIVLGLGFVICRIYAKHHATAVATPPWCDPESYERRLTAAMAKADIQYTDVVSATLAEMDKLWNAEQSLCEKFRINGLADSEDRRLVYDIAVRFYSNGVVDLQFAPDETTPKMRPGILITKSADVTP